MQTSKEFSKGDLFVGVQQILTSKSVVVRVINRAGVPYSIILEQQDNGKFVEMCSTETSEDYTGIKENEMVSNYLKQYYGGDIA